MTLVSLILGEQFLQQKNSLMPVYTLGKNILHMKDTKARHEPFSRVGAGQIKQYSLEVECGYWSWLGALETNEAMI